MDIFEEQGAGGGAVTLPQFIARATNAKTVTGGSKVEQIIKDGQISRLRTFIVGAEIFNQHRAGPCTIAAPEFYPMCAIVGSKVE